MKLDRNLGDGRGKYGLILNRRLAEIGDDPVIGEALTILERAGVIDWADNTMTEAFVIRLKDKYAAVALIRYANSAVIDDPEYSAEVGELAMRAGPNHPHCKRPD